MKHLVSITAVVFFLFSILFAQHPAKTDVPYGFVQSGIDNVNLGNKTLDCVCPTNTYQWQGSMRDGNIEIERVPVNTKWVVHVSYSYLSKNGKRFVQVAKADYAVPTRIVTKTNGSGKGIVALGRLNYTKVPQGVTKIKVRFWYKSPAGKSGWINKKDKAFKNEGNNNYGYEYVVDLATGKVTLTKG